VENNQLEPDIRVMNEPDKMVAGREISKLKKL